MTSCDFIKLLGGLAFFFFGMEMMKEELEQLAGKKMQLFLENFTSTKFVGIIIATIITAIVQSSSLITVMTVSLRL